MMMKSTHNHLTYCKARLNARDVRQGTSCVSVSESISC